MLHQLHPIMLLCYVFLPPMHPVNDVSPPSYEDLYSSADHTAPPSYNEALSPYRITSTVTSSSTATVHPPLQTEPAVAAAVRVASQNSRPPNAQVNNGSVKLYSK